MWHTSKDIKLTKYGVIVICQIAVCNHRSHGFIKTTKEQEQLFIWMTGDYCDEIPNLFYPILRSILLYS